MERGPEDCICEKPRPSHLGTLSYTVTGFKSEQFP